MARLRADENVPMAVVEALRSHGHDVVVQVETVQGAGVSDDKVLTHACREQRAVVTLNRGDFFRLHREQPDHDGIIACTFDPDFTGQAARIHDALSIGSSLRGVLLRVNRPQR